MSVNPMTYRERTESDFAAMKNGKPRPHKLTPEELQAILDDPRPVLIQVMPDGSLRGFNVYPGEFAAPKVLTREEAIAAITGAS